MDILTFDSRDREFFFEAVQLGKEDEERFYLILDRALIADNNSLPPFPDDKEFLLKNTPFDNLMGDGPIVFELIRHSPWLAWTAAEAQTEASCIVSAFASRQEIIAHLRHLTTAVLEGATKTLLFRFYDPRNLDILLRSFTQDESRLFLGPIRKLFWLTNNPAPDGTVPLHPQWHYTINAEPSISKLSAPWALSTVTLTALQQHMEPQIVQEIINNLSRYQDTKSELRRLGAEKSQVLVRLAMSEGIEHQVTHVNEYTQRAKWLLRFGTVFCSDPQYPWASVTPKNESPEERWERSHQMANEAFETIYSSNHRSYEYFTKRLWLLKHQYENFSRLRSEEQIATCLSRLWPERYDAFEQAGIEKMVNQAYQDALAWKLEMPHGWALLSGLYFICGIDALMSPVRYPWLVQIRGTMLMQPVEQRGRWLFQKFQPRINSIYRRYSLPKGEEKKLANTFALKRCLKRVIALNLNDIEKQTKAAHFYEYLYPEQLSRANSFRLNKTIEDSVRCAEMHSTKYKIRHIMPLLAFVAFSVFLRIKNRNNEMEGNGFIAWFIKERGIEDIPINTRSESLLKQIQKECSREYKRRKPEWPAVDVYRNIFAYEGE